MDDRESHSRYKPSEQINYFSYGYPYESSTRSGPPVRYSDRGAMNPYYSSYVLPGEKMRSNGGSYRASEDGESKKTSPYRYILIGVCVAVTIVVLGIIAAVVAVMLSKDADKSSPEPVPYDQTFHGELEVTSMNWVDELADPDSPEYKAAERDFIAMMDEEMKDVPGYNNTVVDDISEGSVVFIFTINIVNAKGNSAVTVTLILDTLKGVPSFQAIVATDLSACRSNPCGQYAKKCINKVDDYKCRCKKGFVGKDCNTNVDDCITNPCQNGGICVDGINSHTCDCAPGTTGANCQIDINECDSNPCEHDGICLNKMNGFECLCTATGWNGTLCEIDVDECTLPSSPCKNGAECTNSLGEYSCQCSAGWTGADCDIDVNECTSNSPPCQNGATCLNEPAGDYKCECDSGWQGKNCNQDVDECTLPSSPCKNGAECTNSLGEYSCQCSAGWTGADCDIDVNECTSNSPPCQNGATCLNEPAGDYKCECDSGWQGKNCNQDVDECTLPSSPCKNGAECTNSLGEYSCQCSAGWTGADCDIDVNECTSNSPPCQNGATCLNEPAGDYKCECDSGWQGKNCNQDVDECTLPSSPCKNGAECTNSLGEYSCQCSAGWTGADCDIASTTSSTPSTPSTPSTTTTDSSSLSTPTTYSTSTPTTSYTTWTTSQTTTTPLECEDDDYHCIESGECIYASWLCDDWDDCNFGEDERHCDCEYGRCKITNADGTGCYSAAEECDGNYDCDDGTDEIGCPFVCGDGLWKCDTFDMCIDTDRRCDGTNDCEDNSDEWLDCHAPPTTPPLQYEYEIRLVGDCDDTNELCGRVEVRRGQYGEFSTVCSDGFDENEAMVICRQLGATGGSHFADGRAYYGQGTGSIYLSNLQCTGTEETLDECANSEWQLTTFCSHAQDASVSCGEDRFTTPIPSTSSTFTPTASSTTAPPSDFNIRLVDGNNCLEGIIQVFYNGEWGTVCDDEFDEYDATVVCRSLGYTGVYDWDSVDFGISDAPILLDDLDCEGSETSLEHCEHRGWEDHNCYTFEQQSIRCVGDPCTDCQLPAADPSVSCSFGEDSCNYQSSCTLGDTTWNLVSSQSLNIPEYLGAENQVMAFRNVNSSVDDSAQITSPPFVRPEGVSQKLEFSYLLQDFPFNALTVSMHTMIEESRKRRSVLEVDTLWTSKYLRHDLESEWVYGCINLDQLSSDTEYQMVFSANCGPTCLVALAGVSLSDGSCKESLLDGPCNFERESECGIGIHPESNILEYAWTRGSSENDNRGHRMTAQSRTGNTGAETDLMFSTPGLNDFMSIKFSYQITGNEILQLMVQQGEPSEIMMTTYGMSNQEWESKCYNLPGWIDNNEPTMFTFTAVRGTDVTTAINLDDVQLGTECTHPVLCDTTSVNCGWTMSSSNESIYWTFIDDSSDSGFARNPDVRLIGERSNSGWLEVLHPDTGEWGGVCDDGFGYDEAKAACHMLGYLEGDHTFRCCNDREGDIPIHLDELHCEGNEESFDECFHDGWSEEDCYYFEHVNVTCVGPPVGALIDEFGSSNFFVLADEGQSYTWAALQTRSFVSTGDDHVMFDFLKEGDVPLQIVIEDVSDGSVTILATITEPTMSVETMCVLLPSSGDNEIHFKLIVIKSTQATGTVAVSNFRVGTGPCTEHLQKMSCDLEKEHRLCGYTSSITTAGCLEYPAWSRAGSKNEVYGHFLYSPFSESSQLNFETIPANDAASVCSVSFNYKAKGEGFKAIVNNEETDLRVVSMVNTWMSKCINIGETCPPDPTTDIDIRFETTNSKAGVDNIMVSTSPCQDGEAQSVNCDFLNGNCGYIMDLDIWGHSEDGNLMIEGSKPDPYLVSPMFSPDIPEVICVQVFVSGTGLVSVSVTLLDETESSVASGVAPLYASSVEKGVSVPFDVTPGNTYSLMFSFDGEQDIIVHNVQYGSCDGVCTEVCDDGKCITDVQICDGMRQCDDGADESDCGMAGSVGCMFESVSDTCGYDLHHAIFINGGIFMNGTLSYLTSPHSNVANPSCLVVDGVLTYLVSVRFAYDREGMLTTLPHTKYRNPSDSFTYLVDVPSGDYDGFVMETFSSGGLFYYFELLLRNITLYEGTCSDKAVELDLEESLTTVPPTEPPIFITTDSDPSGSKDDGGPPPQNSLLSLSMNPETVTIGDQVTLQATMQLAGSMEIVIIVWYFNGEQLARNDHIMMEEAEDTHSVTTDTTDLSRMISSLVINSAGLDDQGTYTCIAEIVGYPEDVWQTSNINVVVSEIDDGCYSILSSGEQHVCHNYGYDRIKAPSDFGASNIHQIRSYLAGIEAIFSEVSESDVCYRPMLDLACGLHASACENGVKVRPICREHCEEVANGCKDYKTIVPVMNSGLQHYCKYLPYSQDNPDCKKIWLGCGQKIMLDDTMPTTVRSEYYPDMSPSSSTCTYSITALPYYNTLVTVNDLKLDSTDCDTDTLLVGQTPFCKNDIDPTETMMTLVEESPFNLSLQSSEASTTNGFHVTLTPELKVGICGVNGLKLNEEPNMIDIDSPTTDGCDQWILYPEGSLETPDQYSIAINVNDVTGCVSINDGTTATEWCDNNDMYIMAKASTVTISWGPDEDSTPAAFTLKSMLILKEVKVTEVRLVHGSDDHEGYIITHRSDGTSGYVCAYLLPEDANVICKQSGFASPALERNEWYDVDAMTPYYKSINEILCRGWESSIDECEYVHWNDCEDCECYQYNLASVKCAPKSVTCDMKQTSCGYTYDEDLFEFTPYKGLLMKSDVKQESTTPNVISSPEFHYGSGTVLELTYALTGSEGERVAAYLSDNVEEKTLLWERTVSNVPISGRYSTSIQLPDSKAMEELQLLIEFDAGKQSAGFGLVDVALTTDVNFNSDENRLSFLSGAPCLFDDLEVCQPIIEGIPCDTKTLGPVWRIEDNVLVGDSLYALPDDAHFIDIPASSDGNPQYLHFKYSQTGIGQSENDLTLHVVDEDLNELFTDSEFTTTIMVPQCVPLPLQLTSVYFGITAHTSVGHINLVNLAINHQQCPHPASCDIEIFEHCKYELSRSTPTCGWYIYQYWNQHTPYVDEEHGHVIGLTCQEEVGEFSAEIVTPLVDISTDMNEYKCVSFWYHFVSRGTDIPMFSLTAKVAYDGGASSSLSIPLYRPGRSGWNTASIPLQPETSTKATFSVTASYWGGDPWINDLLIDDFTFQTTSCIGGLEDIENCDLEDPALCNMDSTSTGGSGYRWTRVNGESLTTSLYHDADGQQDGYWMEVNSKLGQEGDTADLKFNVDLSESTDSHHYQFSYHATSEAGILATSWNGDDWSDPPATGDGWRRSGCYSLPDNFVGQIHLRAIRGSSMVDNIAADNIMIHSGACEDGSVACSYGTDNEGMCGYIGEGTGWHLTEEILYAREAGSLHVPVYSLSADTCIRVDFGGVEGDVLTLNERLDDGSVKSHEFVVGQPTFKFGQINYSINSQGLTLMVEDGTNIDIYSVSTVDGACPSLVAECGDDVACAEQCVPASKRCDRQPDCSDGFDEQDCGFSIACPFETTLCGFETASDSSSQWEWKRIAKISFSIACPFETTLCGFETASDSSSQWEWKETYSYKPNTNTEITLVGGMLLTEGEAKRYTPHYSTVSSVSNHIPADSCVSFKYTGDASELWFNFKNEDGTVATWNDTKISQSLEFGSWRLGQIHLGSELASWKLDITAVFGVSDTPSHMFAAVESISISSGACDVLDCPQETPLQCTDGSVCYGAELHCDTHPYCTDGSDESECQSEFSIPCDFESEMLCGYTSNTFEDSDTKWLPASADRFKMPLRDHTHMIPGSGVDEWKGHFMRVTDKFFDGFSRIKLSSPLETFEADGCVTFWYNVHSHSMMNPIGWSAQLYVDVVYPDTSTSEFLWYDNVNSATSGQWQQGGVSVRGGESLGLEFVAVLALDSKHQPSVAAIDDVAYVPGACSDEVKQVCAPGRSFECTDTRVCIPHSFVCDNYADCADESDEQQNCDIRPEGAIVIAGGDGYYGQALYYHGASWRHVCYSNGGDDDDTVRKLNALGICRASGFHGNYEGTSYTLALNDVNPVMIECSGQTCTTLDAECPNDIYLGVKCSQTVCFSGYRLCPGTSDVCTPSKNFCDGVPHCPDNADEKECYCDIGDAVCNKLPDECEDCETCASRDQLECYNHQCVDRSARCDNVYDCDDGTDELGCVDILDGSVSVWHGDAMAGVCIDGIGKPEADKLCNKAGQGSLGGEIMFGEERISGAVHASMVDGQLQYEEEPNECFPLILNCELPVCGSTMYMDDVIAGYTMGGSEALIGSYPWVVSIHSQYYGPQATGAIINNEWILTVAHAFEYSNYFGSVTVRSGSIHHTELGDHGQLAYAASLYLPPDHSWDVTEGNDIALLKLSSPLQLDDHTRAVCLGNNRSVEDIIAKGDRAECYFTGFGVDETFFNGDDSWNMLTAAKLHVIDRSTCQEQLDALGGTLAYDGICADNTTPYQAACYGDSGGPFVCKKDRGWELFGLASYGTSGCRGGAPTVFASVSKHQEWIERVTGLKFFEKEEEDPQ